MSAYSPYLLLDAAGGPTKYALTDGPLVLGRAADAGIRIDDRSLSNHHCRLEPVPGGWKVVDLQSRNGTFVNDVLVAQRRLEDGDLLRTGRLAFRYVATDEPVEEAPAVEALVEKIHRKSGAAGVKRAAKAFSEAAAGRGVTGLVTSGAEIAGAARLQAVAAAMVSERSERVLFDLIVDAHDRPDGRRARLPPPRRRARGEGTARHGRAQLRPRGRARRAREGQPAPSSARRSRRATRSWSPTRRWTSASPATESVLNLRLRSILCVPVRGREGPIGTIYLDNRFERGVFDESVSCPSISAFADQAALAVENARLHEENGTRLEELEKAKAEVEELNRILADRIAKTSVELQEVKEHVLRERAEAPLKYSLREHRREVAADAGPLPPPRQGDRQRRPGAHPGRERHGQGARRARDPLQRPAQGPAVRQRELRRDPRDASSRASSSATRRAPSRARTADKKGLFEMAAGGHALPRRDRRHADRHAEEAPARAAGEGGPPRRRQAHDPDRRADPLGEQPGPAQGRGGGALPRGPLLPAQRDHGRAAAAARALRGHPPPRRALPRPRSPRPRRRRARRSPTRPSSSSGASTGRATSASCATRSRGPTPCPTR